MVDAGAVCKPLSFNQSCSWRPYARGRLKQYWRTARNSRSRGGRRRRRPDQASAFDAAAKAPAGAARVRRAPDVGRSLRNANGEAVRLPLQRVSDEAGRHGCQAWPRLWRTSAPRSHCAWLAISAARLSASHAGSRASARQGGAAVRAGSRAGLRSVQRKPGRAQRGGGGRSFVARHVARVVAETLRSPASHFPYDTGAGAAWVTPARARHSRLPVAVHVTQQGLRVPARGRCRLHAAVWAGSARLRARLLRVAACVQGPGVRLGRRAQVADSRLTMG